MPFESPPFRPPSEAYSLLIRVTRNCPWNRCEFCAMYKTEKFQLRDVEEIKRDIDFLREVYDQAKEMAWLKGYGGDVRYIGSALGIPWLLQGEVKNVFIGDSDSLVMKPHLLIEVIRYIKEKFPSVERITSYARSRTILNKKFEDLKEIRKAGLTRLHVGLESGDDFILNYVKKGVSSSEAVEAGLKAKEAGFELSEYVISGLGGEKRWMEHALHTADALNRINPHFIRIRTLVVLPFTPLYEKMESGDFVEASPETVMKELRLFIENLNVDSEFLSDHVSNYTDLNGKLPEEKEKLLNKIDEILNLPQQMKERIFKRTVVHL
jgi:radical SAM superfamily enzyme YgiQ (UPF0313 family)